MFQKETTGTDFARRLAEADSRLSELNAEVQQHTTAGARFAMKLAETETQRNKFENDIKLLQSKLVTLSRDHKNIVNTNYETKTEISSTCAPQRNDVNLEGGRTESVDERVSADIVRENDELRAAKYSLERELTITRNDLAVLEKAMEMNHHNLFVGANSQSCVGLAEMREGEIKLLKEQIKGLEDSALLAAEFKKQLENESERKIKEAERRAEALFAAFGNVIFTNILARA